MSLENLKHIFEVHGTNTGTPQVSVKTNLSTFRTPKINILGPTLDKPTVKTNTFTQPPFDKPISETNTFTQPPFDKSTQVTDSFVNTDITNTGTFPPGVAFNDDLRDFETFVNTDITNTGTFPPGVTFNDDLRDFETFVNTDVTDTNTFPPSITLNDVLRSFDETNYFRSPFQSAGNNQRGGLLTLSQTQIDFTSIANKRKTFFTSPYFSTNGTSLWPDATTPTDTSILVSGTYSPIVTKNTLQGPGEYFDSANNLGLRLGKETTWTTLYTKDHQKKPLNFDQDGERSVNPFQPFSYGNPNIASTFGMGDRGRPEGAPPVAGFSRNTEPYIISNILTDDSQGGRDINKGTRSIPFHRALTDFDRISKYLSSPAGLAFAVSSNVQLFIPRNVIRDDNDNLKRVPQRFNSGYNPLATLLAVSPIGRLIGQAMPFVTMKSGFNMSRNFPFVPTPFNTKNYGDAVGTSGGVKHKLNKSFEGGSADSDNVTGFQKFLASASNFLTTGVTTATYTGDGDKMTLADTIAGDEIDTEGEITKAVITHDELGQQLTDQKDGSVISVNIEDESNGMPMYFKDLRNKEYIFFRAFLEGIAENIAPTWTPYNYLGRSEPVFIYERAQRDLNFTLKMYAQTQKELDKIYLKLNKLTSFCYPQYAQDNLISRIGIDGNSKPKTRMKPPLLKFRMGELYGNSRGREILGFIQSLSYVIPEESTWETTAGKRVPKFVTATVQFIVIHNEAPNMDTDFYGINMSDDPKSPIT